MIATIMRGKVDGSTYASVRAAGLPWTPETIKADLPLVRVALPDGSETYGEILGRRLPFAEVHIDYTHVDVNWATLAHLLNEDRALLL